MLTSVRGGSKKQVFLFCALLWQAIGRDQLRSAPIYDRDDQGGFLKIEQIAADGRASFRPLAVKTLRGAKTLREVTGDCAFVLHDLAANRARVIIEATRQSSYRVVYDRDDVTVNAFAIVAEKMGLKVVHEVRPTLVLQLRTTDEKPTRIARFQGKPKWPAAREHRSLMYGSLVPHEIMKFKDGGILFSMWKYDDDDSVARDDKLYFDGVSFGELAEYFEERREMPVVDRTGDTRMYSFSLPNNICRQLSLDHTTPLPDLGLSTVPGKEKTDMMVVKEP